MVKVEADGTRVLHLSKKYLADLKIWERIDDFCDGDRDNLVSKYLVPHISEQGEGHAAKVWGVRKAHTGYENDVQPGLEIHLGHLNRALNFGKLGDNEKFKPIIEDATGYGESAQELYREMLEYLLKHGLVAVLVEGTKDVAESRAGARATGERSYQVLYSARQILDYTFFRSGSRKGQVREVMFTADSVEVNGEMRPGAVRYYFEGEAEQNADQGFKFEKLYEEGDSRSITDKRQYKVLGSPIDGSLPVIPVEIIGRGVEDSTLKDPVQQAWKLFNDKSVRDNINYNQGFVWNIVFGAKETEISSRAEFQITLISNPEAKVMSVPAGEPTGYNHQIEAEERKLQRMLMWEYRQMTSADSAQVQSADSKALDQNSRADIYESITKKMERSVVRVWKLHGLYENVPESEIQVSVARDFGLDDPAATQSTRGIVFGRAERLGVRDIQKNILKLDVQEMQVISEDDEDEDEARARLMKAVDEAEDPLATQNDGVFKRPSIADRVNA